MVEEDEDDQPYQLQVVCRRKSEKYARAQIVQHTGSGGDAWYCAASTPGAAGEDSVALTAYLLSDRHAPARLEQLVAELSLQDGVQAVHWYAGDQDDPMPRAPLRGLVWSRCTGQRRRRVYGVNAIAGFLSVLPEQMRDPVLFAIPFFLLLLILEWTAARKLERIEREAGAVANPTARARVPI